MSLHTVSELKDSVSAILSSVDMGTVDNLNGALERAARVLVQQADIPEASGIQNITLYDGVYDYECDTNIFGTAITDIRPSGVSRPPSDFVYKRMQDDFDRTKGWLPNGTMTTFEYQNGVPIIRIQSKIPQAKVILDAMSDDTGWTAGGSASTVIEDTSTFYHTPSSLRFTLTSSSSGTQTKTLTNSLGLSSYEDVGVAFLAIMIPAGATATTLTSISLKIGSSASAYDSVTSTEGFTGAWTAGNWILVPFNMASATSTGTPDWSAIDYIQVTFSHTGTLTNFRIGDLFISMPSQNQILYQSAAIFKASGASASTTITSNNDTILLNDPAFTLYEYESALSILQQTGGGNGDPTVLNIRGILHGNGNDIGLYARFRGDNPSQELRTAGNWYDPGGYGYGIGGYN